MSRSFLVSALALLGGCQPPDRPAQTYRCSPNQPLCPEGYICCSEDPAALDLDDLDATVLPHYQGRGGSGVPLFSAGNNSLSISGLCLEAGAVPPEGALSDAGAQGCPIPCNPNWTDADIAEICGSNTICCQTLELEREDCVLDHDLGDAGCFRPITGKDIDGLGGLDATQWGTSEHGTHQDPGGSNCMTFVAGVPPDVFASKDIAADELLNACLRRLGVADTRGYCLGRSPSVTACPLDQPTYRDACEQLNDELGRPGCD